MQDEESELHAWTSSSFLLSAVLIVVISLRHVNKTHENCLTITLMQAVRFDKWFSPNTIKAARSIDFSINMQCVSKIKLVN